MGLVRTTSQLSQVIVRRLGDSGGVLRRDVESELDNLIAWAKLSPRCIHRNISTVGNVGAGLDTLHSFSLPANSLQADGDYLTIVYGGNLGNNDNDKRVSASFGGTVYTEMALSDIDGSNQGWNLRASIIRTSSTAVRVTYTLSAQLVGIDSANAVNTLTNGYYTISATREITGLSNLNSNAMTILCQGEGTNNNDVDIRMAIIELCQQ